ncbi:hypothetical protein RvY_15123 [Ramazzottius varieornatus]|uniref:DDE-1 domain-containing protein n=1 Tax=Ramazzottius varieornatus TaxID=947166 RepID=A0A1D1VXB4_RAMVA|nr:hypothetical protein RvY_15123 [Ramazzottius varieornatus]
MNDNTKDKLYVAVNRSGIMDQKVLTDYFRQEVLPDSPDKSRHELSKPLDSCPFGTMKSKWTAYKSFHPINPQFEVIKHRLKLLKEPGRTTPKSRGGKKQTETAHGPSPAASVPDADIH